MSYVTETDDDLIPDLLPGSATLSLSGPAGRFASLFARAAAVTPMKELVPGTSYALLEAFPASGGTSAHVRITATDAEQTVSVVADGITVKVPGSVLLPPKKVQAILGLIPNADVQLIVVGSDALIRSGRSQWTVSVPVSEFADLAALADVSEAETRAVPAKALQTALTAVRKAASSTNARAALMQVQFKDGAVTACDGGRLHRVEVPGLDPTLDTTVPVRVVDELIRALPGAQECLVGSTDRFLVFGIDSASIVAQRLILPFPDVSTLILEPRLTNTLSLIVNRAELDEAVRRVRVNADPESAVVTLSLVRGVRSADDWMLEVRCKDRARNTAMETISCSWDGKVTEVMFNHHHLSDLLSVCSSEFLNLRLSADTKTRKSPLFVEDGESGVLGVVQQVTQYW